MLSNLKILLAMLIWGSLGVMVRSINLPSLEISFVRAFVSGLSLLLLKVFFFKTKTRYSRKSLLILLASGVALGLNWVLLFKALKHTTISNATMSYYMAPVFAVVLARVLFKEKLSLEKIISMGLSVFGLMVIISHSSGGGQADEFMLLGIAFGLSAAVFYALIILANRFVKDVPSVDKTLVQLLTSALVLFPFVLMRRALVIEDHQTLFLLLVIGIVHTLVPYLLYFDSVKKVSVLNSAVLSYVDPLAAVLLGFVVYGEVLTLYHLLGGFMIVLSTLISVQFQSVDTRSKQVRRPLSGLKAHR